jgi:hypothetical protein
MRPEPPANWHHVIIRDREGDVLLEGRLQGSRGWQPLIFPRSSWRSVLDDPLRLPRLLAESIGPCTGTDGPPVLDEFLAEEIRVLLLLASRLRISAGQDPERPVRHALRMMKRSEYSGCITEYDRGDFLRASVIVCSRRGVERALAEGGMAEDLEDFDEVLDALEPHLRSICELSLSGASLRELRLALMGLRKPRASTKPYAAKLELSRHVPPDIDGALEVLAEATDAFVERFIWWRADPLLDALDKGTLAELLASDVAPRAPSPATWN